MEIYNALPYDITKRIKQNIISEDDINDGKDSFYVFNPSGKIEIRVSNHCTHLWTWHERQNGKSDDIIRISIVFEETDTYSDANLVLRRHRKTPLKVMEYIYRIDNPQMFTPNDVKLVINAIKQCVKKGEMYNDPTRKLKYSKMRISINPPSNKNNQEDITENKNMKKNRIRLTESQLHRVIKESVKNILSEMSGNDIALINGSCADDSYTLLDELEDLGMDREETFRLAGLATPQEGNWLRGINILKKAGVWNENYKQAYKEMVDGFFENAKRSYDAGLRVLETYG